MKLFLLLIAAITLNSSSSFSQESVAVNDKEAAYKKMIDTRAEKIVAVLGINDASKTSLVKTYIADQYKNLNDIYAFRDHQLKIASEQTTSENKEIINAQVNKIKDETTAKTDSLHKIFIAQLANNLTPQQVDQVKDGMTYNVLHVTYNGYNQMIRTLTKEQNEQIMAWLIEAREHAMDAESSDKKHAWFGKYKGRINNYLSAAGYDLKKEGEEWQKRIKEEAEKKQATKGA